MTRVKRVKRGALYSWYDEEVEVVEVFEMDTVSGRAIVEVVEAMGERRLDNLPEEPVLGSIAPPWAWEALMASWSTWDIFC